MLQIQAVAIKLGDPARRDQHTHLVAAKLEDVERGEESPAEGQGHAVVGRRGEGQEVDARARLGDGDGAAGVGGVGDRGDGDGEEGCHFDYLNTLSLADLAIVTWSEVRKKERKYMEFGK